MLCAWVVLGVAFRGGVVAWLGLCVGGLAWAGPGASGGWNVRFFMRIEIPTQRLPVLIFIIDVAILLCKLIEECEFH